MMTKKEVKDISIGIIGGTGLYDPNIFTIKDERKVYTPYGETSDKITICELNGRNIAFISRHGKGHRIPPHKINFRANIWALKELGVKKILAPSAVGSLKAKYRPSDIVIPDQYIDFTKNREYTFYDGGIVCHISQANPFCPDLQSLVSTELEKLSFKYHNKGTYTCIEGPRFSTIAESTYYRKVLNADIIGMTLVPECILAREMEICYLSISTITDYDVWSKVHVNSREIIETLNTNVTKIKKILGNIIPKISDKQNKCECGSAQRDALI